MNPKARTAVLVLAILSVTVPLIAMTQHDGWMFRETNGDVSCQAWFEAASTPRAVTARLYSPSGTQIAYSHNAATQYKNFMAYASAAPVGSGTYTCVADFEELGFPDEYDTQNYSLHVD